MPILAADTRYSAFTCLLFMVAGAQAYAAAEPGNARLVCQLEKRESGDKAVSGDILYEQVMVELIRAGKQFSVKGRSADIQFSISTDDPDDVREDASTLVVVAHAKRDGPSASEDIFHRFELSKPWVSGASLHYVRQEFHYFHHVNNFFSETSVTGECHQN